MYGGRGGGDVGEEIRWRGRVIVNNDRGKGRDKETRLGKVAVVHIGFGLVKGDSRCKTTL